MTGIAGSYDDLVNFARTPGFPIGRIVDARRELTAIVESELYGTGGDRVEGRAALRARQMIDDFVLATTQEHLVSGSVENLAQLKRAIVLGTLAELVGILDRARVSRGLSSSGIKPAMMDLVADPDRFDRFGDADKAAIRKIAGGLSFLALRRFERLHEDIRRRGIPYMG